jgi:plastocyanin
MDNGTLFYICGGALAASAVVASVLGLKVKGFPGRMAPLVFAWFALLVGCAGAFSVLHAEDEEHHAEAAGSAAESVKLEAEEHEEAEVEAAEEAAGKGSTGGEKPAQGEQSSAAEGPGGTLQLAASPTDIAFDKTSLSSKPGEVTIDFDNPSAIEHDVAIERDGEEIAASDRVTDAATSVSAELEAGSYAFLCTVPGHAEAGMEGTLTVR